jgi:hypothetical protein
MTKLQARALEKWRKLYPNAPLPRLKRPKWPEDERLGQQEFFENFPFERKPIRFYHSDGYAIWKGCERDAVDYVYPKKRRRS